MNCDYSGKFIEIIKKIFKETSKQLVGYKYINTAKLMELYVELNRIQTPNLRINASVNLLENSDDSCTEIAYRCGFLTSAQFSYIFKKKFGLSPLQYKKQFSK